MVRETSVSAPITDSTPRKDIEPVSIVTAVQDTEDSVPPTVLILAMQEKEVLTIARREEEEKLTVMLVCRSTLAGMESELNSLYSIIYLNFR